MIDTHALPLWKDVEVLVVGAGSAGSIAAITAASLGKETLLVERHGFMGGISSGVLDTFYGFFTPGDPGRKVIGGVPDRVLDGLRRQGVYMERPNTYGAGTGITYDPETLKFVYEVLALEAGVELLYYSFCTDVVVEDGRIREIIVDGKKGLRRIRAEVVIDTTGDADVAARAGVPFEDASAGGKAQSLTTIFRLGNVDEERARAVSRSDLVRLMREAIQSGHYQLPREDGSIHITPLPGVMGANMTRISSQDATDPEALTRAEVEGRRQTMEYVRFFRECVPGYEHSYLLSLGAMIGVRESRRILGEYQLTRDDVMAGRKFPDAIAMCGAPIEDHHAAAGTHWEFLAPGAAYDIPFRCLVPRAIDGLLVAGRCLSATHDAHASARSIGQCMGMGQAAGAAAVQALEANVAPRAVDTARLQHTLLDLGAILDLPVEARG
jgi:glycine/D-amino acid oxidase-like deaminating enzyme